MTYRMSALWEEFLRHLETSDDEDMRQIGEVIEERRVEEDLDDRALRRYVESGRYGRSAQALWQAFIRANTR